MLWSGPSSATASSRSPARATSTPRRRSRACSSWPGYDPNSEPGKLRVLPESPLPKEWRPAIAGKTRRELRLANGSSYRALTATQPIARGLAAYWGLADEYAFWPWPAASWPPWSRAVPGCTSSRPVTARRCLRRALRERRSRTRCLPDAVHRLRCRPQTREDWYRTNVEEAQIPKARREHARACRDAFRSPEGAFFKRFRAERHVQEIEIVDNWPTWRAIDFGYRHPACLWAQRSPAGQLFVVDELLPCDTTTPEFVAQIKARERSFGLAVPVIAKLLRPGRQGGQRADRRERVRRLYPGGLRPSGKSSSVRDGCVRIMDLLADEAQPLVVPERCVGLIRALSQVKPLKV